MEGPLEVGGCGGLAGVFESGRRKVSGRRLISWFPLGSSPRRGEPPVLGPPGPFIHSLLSRRISLLSSRISLLSRRISLLPSRISKRLLLLFHFCSRTMYVYRFQNFLVVIPCTPREMRGFQECHYPYYHLLKATVSSRDRAFVATIPTGQLELWIHMCRSFYILPYSSSV